MNGAQRTGEGDGLPAAEESTERSPPGRAIEDGLPPGQRGRAFFAVGIAVCMATLDTAIVNTALPTIAGDIGADPASSIWVVSAYQLAMISALLPLAALGEICGHRRVFIAGVALFTVTSLACGYAWSLPTLVVARGLQGLGAAALMSVNVALIRFIYPLKMLGRGVGLNALMVGVAFTVGPTVASCILSVATWHWLFLINVPFGIAAVIICVQTLPPTRQATHRFDGVAAILCATFFACLILAIGEGSHGSAPVLVAGEFALSALALGALLLRQARHPAPMLAVDLFRDPMFALSAVTSVCAFTCQGLAFVSLPFLLQNVLGHSPVETGFLITPWPALVALIAPIAGRLSDRYPVGILGGIGLIAMAAGMASLALLPAAPSAVDIAWRTMRRRSCLAHDAVRSRVRVLPIAQPAGPHGERACEPERGRERHHRHVAPSRPDGRRRARRPLLPPLGRARTMARPLARLRLLGRRMPGERPAAPSRTRAGPLVAEPARNPSPRLRSSRSAVPRASRPSRRPCRPA